jgi:hypothetical protein
VTIPHEKDTKRDRAKAVVALQADSDGFGRTEYMVWFLSSNASDELEGYEGLHHPPVTLSECAQVDEQFPV